MIHCHKGNLYLFFDMLGVALMQANSKNTSPHYTRYSLFWAAATFLYCVGIAVAVSRQHFVSQNAWIQWGSPLHLIFWTANSSFFGMLGARHTKPITRDQFLCSTNHATSASSLKVYLYIQTIGFKYVYTFLITSLYVFQHHFNPMYAQFVHDMQAQIMDAKYCLFSSCNGLRN